MGSWNTTPAADITPDSELGQRMLAQFPVVELLTGLFGSTPTFPLVLTAGIEPIALFSCLDTASLRLFDLVQVRPVLSWAEARFHATGLSDDELNEAAQILVATGMVQAAGDDLWLHPNADGLVVGPIPVLRQQLQTVTSDELAIATRLWGLDGGTRKMDRAEVLLDLFNDRTALSVAIDKMPDEARSVFTKLVDAYHHGLPASDDDIYGAEEPLDIPTDALDRHRNPPSLRDKDPFSPVRVSVRRLAPDLPITSYIRRRVTSASAVESPTDHVRCRQLAFTDFSGWDLTMWAEVWWSVKEPDAESWRPHPAPTPAEPEGPAVGPQELNRLSIDLLDHVASRPAEGKKSGDRGVPVKYWRTAAKAIKASPDTVVMLGGLLIQLGLITAVIIPTKSRARNAKDGVEWHAHPSKVAAWTADSPALNWLRLLDAWMPQRSDRFHHRHHANTLDRFFTLSLLRQLPPGTGAPIAELISYGTDRHLSLGSSEGQELEDVIKELALLGVINNGPVVGLTPAAVAAYEGVDALMADQRRGERSFVVQPDHSIIGPADLAPDVAAELARIAVAESTGGAAVWRLDRDRIAQAARSDGPEPLVAFLAEHSTVPVPDTVERFVVDCAAGSASVSVRPAGAVVTGDPATIITAARHKQAKLEVLAPGVAVSALDHHKLAGVLAAKGIDLATADPTTSATGATSDDVEAATNALMKRAASPLQVTAQADPKAELSNPTAWHRLEADEGVAAEIDLLELLQELSELDDDLDL